MKEFDEDALAFLGLDRQGVLELQLKAEIHRQILGLIQAKEYRQKDLVRLLGIAQPRVSELLRGKLFLLSVARLLYYAEILGAGFTVELRKVPARRAKAWG